MLIVYLLKSDCSLLTGTDSTQKNKRNIGHYVSIVDIFCIYVKKTKKIQKVKQKYVIFDASFCGILFFL